MPDDIEVIVNEEAEETPQDVTVNVDIVNEQPQEGDEWQTNSQIQEQVEEVQETQAVSLSAEGAILAELQAINLKLSALQVLIPNEGEAELNSTSLTANDPIPEAVSVEVEPPAQVKKKNLLARMIT